MSSNYDSPKSEEAISEQEEAFLNFLRVATEPFTRVLEAWEATFKQRKKIYLNVSLVKLSNDFPYLKLNNGIELIRTMTMSDRTKKIMALALGGRGKSENEFKDSDTNRTKNNSELALGGEEESANQLMESDTNGTKNNIELGGQEESAKKFIESDTIGTKNNIELALGGQEESANKLIESDTNGTKNNIELGGQEESAKKFIESDTIGTKNNIELGGQEESAKKFIESDTIGTKNNIELALGGQEESANKFIEKNQSGIIFEPSSHNNVPTVPVNEVTNKLQPVNNIFEEPGVRSSSESSTDGSEFIPEEEMNAINSDTSLESETNTEESDKNEETVIDECRTYGIRKRKKVNKRQTQKVKRNRGEKYVTSKGLEKKERQVKSHTCLIGKCPNKCRDFDEETRASLFKTFWALPYQGQRDFIASNITVREVKRRRVGNAESRKDFTRGYYLLLLNERVKVCRKFFMNTLDVTDKLLRYTELHRNEIVSMSQVQVDRRGRHPPKNKTAANVRTDVINFIKMLPAVPSHYCRKQSTRKYLPSELKNVTNLHRLYKTYQEKENKTFVSLAVFKKNFHDEFNMTFHVPRKDKSVLCEQFNRLIGPHSEDETEKFTGHILEKEQMKIKFLEDQGLSNSKENNNCLLCTSFDLQKVLGTPHVDNFLIGFTSRYAVYNLTFYESGTRNVECFLWEESQGKKGANEVCSIVIKYLESVDARGGITEILLYCDNCSGQNKNYQMMSALNWFLKKSINVKKIVLNVLLPGHSYMPVDSVHGTIENSIRNKVVWAPSEWSTIIRNARVKYTPYKVHTLNYKDFLDWKTLQMKTFTNNLRKEDGSTIKLRDVRLIMFEKEDPNYIHVSTSSFRNEMSKIAIKKETRTSVNHNITIGKAYNARLPIATEKYQGLKNLCTKNVIPIEYQHQYLTLPTKPTVPHCLMETDEEDEVLGDKE
ncbi:unnamed protein product [Ceutorhynchus assimilis]|uniref:DUF7869 domain-containing protein n=1 Tax=Ceutorhynchus assimilis TaxID=467358 RepID=A0A9N9QSC8_9CUCU|nr:unnamed protein product [Ceutorhynchus assimilis]